jgi:uncharacterized protein
MAAGGHGKCRRTAIGPSPSDSSRSRAADHGRAHPPAVVTDRVPAALREFAALFNDGEFWESHEVLEGPWRESRSDFLQGLILLASAWVHVQRGNPRGIAAQLRKTERRLSHYRPFYLGVDVDGLLVHAERTRALVARHPDAPPAAWPGLAPAPELRLSAALLRGDEPELGRG